MHVARPAAKNVRAARSFHRGIAFVLIALVAAASIPDASAQAKPTAPATTQPTTRPAPAQITPRISDGLLRALLNAWNGASTAFTGLSEMDDGSMKVFVSSARQVIARKGYELAGTRGGLLCC